MAQKTLSLNAHVVPVRPAPPPPSSHSGGGSVKSGTSRVPFGSAEPSRTPMTESQKKKAAPPPRPPPPKASAQLRAVQNALIFTEMMQPKRPPPPVNTLLLTSSQTAPDLLINWDSPPTSPTPGRSSSDGLSLKSFGSDSSGTATSSGLGNGLHHPRSESGFESESDAWTIGEAVASNVPRSASQPSALVQSVKPFSMPTIIRPTSKPGSKGLPPPPPAALSGSSTHLKALEKVNAIRPTTPSGQCDFTSSHGGSSSHLADLLDLDVNDQWTNYDDDYSPPEPCMPPPPAPPTFLLTESSPPPPPPVSTSPVSSAIPSAVALYDYHSSHPGDLNFKEGDRIRLLARVSEEWFQGSVDSVEGMFPVSYVRVFVPLDSDQTEAVVVEPRSSSPLPVNEAKSYRAVAVYAFAAETNEDLSLQEGDEVEVNECLGNGWLYGRHYITGQSGQFPEAFVVRQA